MSKFLDAAQSYIARGWSVVPAHRLKRDSFCTCRRDDCRTPGKHPAVRWSTYTNRRASDGEIENWWKRDPNRNVAIVTGRISGLVVVDVDPRHGGDVVWEHFSHDHDIPDTLSATSPSGGQHYYFKHPMKDEERVKGLVALMDGVDIRADGNIIMAPPSENWSESANKWREYSWWDFEAEMEEFPEILLTMISSAEGSGTYSTEKTPEWEEVLNGDMKATEGIRNSTMTQIAGHYFGQGKDTDEVLSMCMGINHLQFVPPLDASEVQLIVNSIAKREGKKARIREEVRQVVEENAEPVEEHNSDDRVAKAAELFKILNVPAVTEWVIYRGDANEYFLYTPEDEASMGADLLNYGRLRSNLLNSMNILAPTRKELDDAGGWDKLAKGLRQWAREDVIVETKAADRLEEWLEAYISDDRLYAPEMEERRDALMSGPILVPDRNENKYVHLRPQAFASYVQFFGEKLAVTELTKLLQRAGWTRTTVATGKTTMRALRSPEPYQRENQ